MTESWGNSKGIVCQNHQLLHQAINFLRIVQEIQNLDQDIIKNYFFLFFLYGNWLDQRVIKIQNIGYNKTLANSGCVILKHRKLLGYSSKVIQIKAV